ncbi:hypothetical protein Tco_1272869 [Tanacetum coccineum]
MSLKKSTNWEQNKPNIAMLLTWRMMYKGLKTKQKRYALAHRLESCVSTLDVPGSKQAEGGGQRWSAAVDHYRWPPLTAIDRWSGSGSGDGDGTVIMPHGTNHMVTRGLLMIDSRLCMYEVWYEVQVRWRLVNDLEGHVEVASWWIGWRTINADPSQSLAFIESVECCKDQITSRSGSIIGWIPERTNLPSHYLGYINQQTQQRKGC